MDTRGERGQLVGYKDSIYRVQIPSKYKVKRTLYCQFVEEGELTEILGTEPEVIEEINQQFEPNIIEPRGKVLDIPDNYTIETVNPDTIDERNKHFTDELNDPIVQDDTLNVVDSSTKESGLLQLGQDARDLQDSDDEPVAGYKRIVPGALNELVDKTLQRSTRSRIQTVRAIEADKPKARKTRKPRTNYTLANIPIVSVKALTVAIVILEELGIVEPKLYKELQTLPEAA